MQPIRLRYLLVVTLSLCTVVPGAAATFQYGDVLAAHMSTPEVTGPSLGTVVVIRGGVAAYTPLSFEAPIFIAVSRQNEIFVLHENVIAVYDTSGNLRRELPAVAECPVGLALDAAGNIYVSSSCGGFLPPLVKLDSAGHYVGRYMASSGMDLAADQCTVYFTWSKYLQRIDVCRNVALADVSDSLPGRFYDVRILRDGSFLLRGQQQVIRLAPNGSVMKTYPIDADALALATDGRTFWASSFMQPGLYQVDIESGAVQNRFSIPRPNSSLAVVGEPRAALTLPTDIPVFARPAVVLLLIGLMGLAFFRIK